MSSCCAASKTKSAWRSVSRASRTTSAWSFCSCEGQRGDRIKAHDLLALLAVGEQADGADEQAVEVLFALERLGEGHPATSAEALGSIDGLVARPDIDLLLLKKTARRDVDQVDADGLQFLRQLDGLLDAPRAVRAVVVLRRQRQRRVVARTFSPSGSQSEAEMR